MSCWAFSFTDSSSLVYNQFNIFPCLSVVCFSSAHRHGLPWWSSHNHSELADLITLRNSICQVIWPTTCSSLSQQDPVGPIILHIQMSLRPGVAFVLRHAGFQLWAAQPHPQPFLLAPAEPFWLAPIEKLAWEPLSGLMGTTDSQRNYYSSSVFS